MTSFKYVMLQIVLRVAVGVLVILLASCSCTSKFQLSSNAWVEYDRRNDIYKLVWNLQTIHIITPKDTIEIDSVLVTR